MKELTVPIEWKENIPSISNEQWQLVEAVVNKKVREAFEFMAKELASGTSGPIAGDLPHSALTDKELYDVFKAQRFNDNDTRDLLQAMLLQGNKVLTVIAKEYGLKRLKNDPWRGVPRFDLMDDTKQTSRNALRLASELLDAILKQASRKSLWLHKDGSYTEVPYAQHFVYLTVDMDKKTELLSKLGLDKNDAKLIEDMQGVPPEVTSKIYQNNIRISTHGRAMTMDSYEYTDAALKMVQNKTPEDLWVSIAYVDWFVVKGEDKFDYNYIHATRNDFLSADSVNALEEFKVFVKN